MRLPDLLFSIFEFCSWWQPSCCSRVAVASAQNPRVGESRSRWGACARRAPARRAGCAAFAAAFCVPPLFLLLLFDLTVINVVYHRTIQTLHRFFFLFSITALPAARGWPHRAGRGPHPRAGSADQAGVRQVRRVQRDQEHGGVRRRAQVLADEGPARRRGDRDRHPRPPHRPPGGQHHQPAQSHLPRARRG